MFMIELQVGFPWSWLSKCGNFLAQMWLLILYISKNILKQILRVLIIYVSNSRNN